MKFAEDIEIAATNFLDQTHAKHHIDVNYWIITFRKYLSKYSVFCTK